MVIISLSTLSIISNGGLYILNGHWHDSTILGIQYSLPTVQKKGSFINLEVYNTQNNTRVFFIIIMDILLIFNYEKNHIQ